MRTSHIVLSTLLLALCILLITVFYYNTPLVETILTNRTQEIERIEFQKTEEEKADYQILTYASQEDSYIIDKVQGVLAIESTAALCNTPVMGFTNYANTRIHIVSDLNFGSERPIQNLYKIDVGNKTCTRMNVSNQVGDFGGYEVSPDGQKLVVALESRPRVITLIDLINDTAKVIATVPQGRTFNGGFGGLSNNFVMVWTDAQTLQYEIYEDVPESQAIDGLKPQVQTQIYRIEE
jgi:spore coat protein U-like protein